jgi:hypothetical protein
MEQGFNLTKKLHTDVLEEKYGTIHSEVLRHNNEVREVHMLDKDNISRTYAITFFTFDRNNEEIIKIDKEIKDGGLIGKTFREHGYEVRKNVISVFITELPDSLKQKMKTEEKKAKVRLSEFYAKKEGENPFIYGVVSEIYSPDFRPALVNETDISQDNPITEAMEKAGITKNEIWDRLGRNNDFSDIKERFEQAKSLAVGEETLLKDKVEAHILK